MRTAVAQVTGMSAPLAITLVILALAGVGVLSFAVACLIGRTSRQMARPDDAADHAALRDLPPPVIPPQREASS